MLTCFIRSEYGEASQKITLIMFLSIPTCFILYSIFLCFKMCCYRKLHLDIEMSKFFYKYIIFITVYFLFNAPMCLLYVLSIKKHIEINTFLSWLSFVNLFDNLVLMLHDMFRKSCTDSLKTD
jgi:hypothetical protein